MIRIFVEAEVARLSALLDALDGNEARVHTSPEYSRWS